MKERLIRLVATTMILVLVSGWMWLISPFRGPIVREPKDDVLDGIKVGMTRDEVIATVGFPPGDFTGGAGFCFDAKLYPNHERWVCLETTLLVRFDEAGIASGVARKATMYKKRTPSSSWW